MSDPELNLRITVVKPPAGVLFSLQDKDNRPVDQQMSDGGILTFNVPVRVGGRPNDGRYLGKFVRNADGRRYIYCASGRLAGQLDSCWERRAKVMLDTIDPELVRNCLDLGKRLQAQFAGTSSDGGPFCGAVQPMEGWSIGPD